MTDTPRPGEGMFFTAAPAKLVLMSVCTLGLYDIYWFWQNWRLYDRRSTKRIKPLLRASIFLPFWVYPMFREIRNAGKELGVPVEMPPIVLTAAYLYFAMFGWSDGPECLLSFFGVVPLAMANQAALKINRAATPFFTGNNRMSIKNWIAVVIGGALTALAVYDVLFP